MQSHDKEINKFIQILCKMQRSLYFLQKYLYAAHIFLSWNTNFHKNCFQKLSKVCSSVYKWWCIPIIGYLKRHCITHSQASNHAHFADNHQQAPSTQTCIYSSTTGIQSPIFTYPYKRLNHPHTFMKKGRLLNLNTGEKVKCVTTIL